MSKLQQRLDTVWDKPDFNSFFNELIKRPVRKIKKGDTLFYQGDETNKLTYIKSGYVKLFQTAEDGKEPVVYLYGPPTILGLRALTSKNHEYWHSGEALTDCEVISVPVEEYKQILLAHPEYIIDLLYLFIQRLNYTERRLYGFIAAETTTRVAAFLYDCVLRFGEKSGTKTAIPVPLTHQLISEFVGSARESVTISLNKLEKEGLIKHSRGSIAVLNISKLQNHAGIS